MRHCFTILFLLLCSSLFAQQKDTVNANSTLTHATVYYGYGTELQHELKASLGSGIQHLVINNIALQPDANTIQIYCPENVAILSYYHRIYTKPVIEIPRVIPVKSNDSIVTLRKQQAALNNRYQINEDIIRRISTLIENNFVTPDKKYINSDELIKLTNYYTGRVKDLKMELYDWQVKVAEINEKINEITRRLSELPNPNQNIEAPKPMGQLILEVMAKNAGTVDFGVSYFTNNAGWIPSYDIRMKTIDNSLKIAYKASVSQNTGLDWKSVKLSLSTSNPNQGGTLPVLSPLFLQLYVPELYRSMIQAKPNAMNNNAPQLNEVVITADYKKVNKDLGYSVNTVNASDLGNYTNLKESQLNTNFEIDLPYDIPSNGKAYNVAIKEEIVPATYQHFAIPKLDNDVFLVAALNNWDSLSLMPGDANIIMDNVYLGKSFIDPNITADTLKISLGRDKRVAVKRVLVKSFSKTTYKGDKKTETFTYEITVKNNKKQPLDLMLKDQYPITRVKEVEVTVGDIDGADENKELGILNWNIKLDPGESRKIRFSYSIRYPKDKKLQEVR